MLKVGVTGGIGSGKSTVCEIFKCLGIPVFNADAAGRELLAEDTEVIEKVKTIFGEGVLLNGKPDRKKIAEIVFGEPEKLKQLNAVIHPAVRAKFNNWVMEQTSSYVIDEAAILFETGLYKQLDAMVLVTAPENIRVERVMHRDAINEAAVKDRMKNQWSDVEKKAIADFEIVNDGTTPLIVQVMEIHNKILSRLK